MNELKLKLLIKFDQIKVLEEFYNGNNEPEKQIHLEIEVSDNSLQELAELIHTRSSRQKMIK